MAFPPNILKTARGMTHDGREPRHNFTPVDEPAVIGYVTGPGPHDPDIAIGVAVETTSGLENCVVNLVQDTERPDLHWVEVQQNDGAYLYTWQSGNKTYHHLLASTRHPAYAPYMARAAEAKHRLHLALRLHVYSGLPFPVLVRLARTITTYGHAQLAIGLAAWLLQQEGHLPAAVDRAERLAVMKNNDRLRNLAGFPPAEQWRTGDTLARLTRGACIVLAAEH